MKIFCIFLSFTFGTDEVPHDPEALGYCHNACQGQDNSIPGTGYCPDGFYPSMKDCEAYYLCWNDGKLDQLVKESSFYYSIK